MAPTNAVSAGAPVTRDVAPYLKAPDGSPYSYSGRPYVDAVLDPFARALCQTCVSGILPDGWTSGPALPHHPKIIIDSVPQAPFVWWFTTKIPAAARAAFYAYLAAPACSPATHAWLERAVFLQQLQVRDEANAKLYEIRGREKGWSIHARLSDVPDPVCAWCPTALTREKRVTITAPGTPTIAVCPPCWSEIVPELVALVRSKKGGARG